MTKSGNRVGLVWALMAATVLPLSVEAQKGPPAMAGNKGVPGLQAQIQTLNGQIASLQGTVTSLQGQLADKEATIAALQAERAAKDAEIASLEGQIATLQNDLAAKNDAIAALQAQVAALQNKARLPQTEQTVSYAAGDDGAVRAGVPIPSPRFTDNADGTVTDTLTGLIWLQNANCFVPQVWGSALKAATTLASGGCGLSDGSQVGDWRLPNVRELYSLIDHTRANPSLPAGSFLKVPTSAFYWTSTAAAGNPKGHAHCVITGDADIAACSHPSKILVWPVRGGR